MLSKAQELPWGGSRDLEWAALGLGMHLWTKQRAEVHEGLGQGQFFWALECDLEEAQTMYRPATGLLPPTIQDAAPDLRRTHLLPSASMDCDTGIASKAFGEKAQ